MNPANLICSPPVSLPAEGVWARVYGEGPYTVEVAPASRDPNAGPPSEDSCEWGVPEVWVEEGRFLAEYPTLAAATQAINNALAEA